MGWILLVMCVVQLVSGVEMRIADPFGIHAKYAKEQADNHAM